jgi:hypothetical protein
MLIPPRVARSFQLPWSEPNIVAVFTTICRGAVCADGDPVRLLNHLHSRNFRRASFIAPSYARQLSKKAAPLGCGRLIQCADRIGTADALQY